MTDITDQDRRTAIDVAEAIERGDYPMAAMWPIMARVILATVDAPAPTLAEELREWAEDASYDEDRDNLLHAATRAEQIEQERDEASAEVERLTAANENLRRTDNYRQFRERFLTVQKGAERNAETPNPADVKPGEAWIVECRGERRAAVKDSDDTVPWCTVNADGWFNAEDNEDVTLVSRLVPAPRVITNPDELDQAKRRTVILSTDGQADVYQKDSNGEWLDVTGHGYPSRQVIRMENAVTVLWEPGA